MDALSPYVEPASRAQLVSKLRHLVRFSDLLLLITGEGGSGRSTVLAQLQAQQQEAGDPREIRLRFDATVDVTHLLKSLVEALDLDCPADADNRTRLTLLHRHSRTLHEAGVPLILLLDDADYLTNNALELLINFALLEDSAPRVVLTAGPEFEQRLIANELDQLLDGRLHVQRLEPFAADEAEAFVAGLLPVGTELSARQISKLVEQAGGQPGQLQRALQARLRDGAVARPAARSLPLPRVHLIAVALVLLAIVGTSVWLYLPESDSETEVAATRVLLPIDIPVPATEPVEQVIGVREELQQRLHEQELQMEAGNPPAPETEAPAVAASAAVDGVQSVSVANVEVAAAAKAPLPELEAPAPVEAETAPRPAEPEPEPKPEPEKPTPVTPAVVKQSSPPEAERPATAVVKPTPTRPQSGAHPQSRADELLKWPDSGYTLQLLAARAEESVEQFLKAQSNPERFYYFKTTYKNAPWHVVVYGQFADRAAAMNAVKTLPAELRKLRPWARSVAGVKSDIRK